MERNKIEKIAADIIEIEDGFDDSMFSHVMGNVIEEYAGKRSEDLFDFFDIIMDKQKKTVKSYGDADVTLKKLKVKNIPESKSLISSRKEYEALQLIVECGSIAFIVISEKKYVVSNDGDRLIRRNIYVYYCSQEKIKAVDISEKLKKSYSPGLSFKAEMTIIEEDDYYTEPVKFYNFKRNNFESFTEVYKELRNIKKQIL